MADGSFWDDPEEAQRVVARLNRTKRSIGAIRDFRRRAEDLQAMVELLEETEGEEAESYAEEVAETAERLERELDTLEIASFLNGPLDDHNAIVTVHAGAGGTESCDWAEMLFRMYTRWAEASGYDVEIQDVSEGDEAGVNAATFRIVGANAFGYAKAERGVHRLVRISPFDSGGRRHTSFSSVDVIAEVSDDVDVEVNDSDIRVDTFRASGKGGQHVNMTDSAVRMTHVPTGIVVSCQSERSQIKNRATAFRTLKSRIYEKKLDEKRAEMERFYGAKGEIAWGNQIRSYVFHPYQMVKDLRTGVETGNVQAVMDGALDLFIHAWLRAGRPANRQAAEDRIFNDE